MTTIVQTGGKSSAKVADEPITVVCSGRTDSGVHASSRSFDTVAHRDPYNWVMGVNTQLPNDISLSWAQRVDPEFHARFCARSRRYVYLIRQSSFRSALLRNSITFTHKRLDPELMAEAGRSLLGTHDFNAYRSAQCQAKTSVRTLSHMGVHCHEGLIAVHVEANGFLQNMVENIIDVLTIGAQEEPVIWAKEILESKDRTKGGVTAPPCGLYLGPYDDHSVFKNH